MSTDVSVKEISQEVGDRKRWIRWTMSRFVTGSSWYPMEGSANGHANRGMSGVVVPIAVACYDYGSFG